MVKNYIDKVEKEMVQKLCELTAIPSVYDPEGCKPGQPFGEHVAQALEYVLDLARELGFQTRNYDGYAGEITVGSGSRMIGILCHTDVVSPGEGWDTPAFSPVIKDGKIYARGASDDKGPIIGALYGLRYLEQEGLIPKDTCIRMIVGTDEEEGWQCIRHYLDRVDTLPAASIVPDGNFPLIYCEKGLLDFDLIWEGQPDRNAGIQLVSLKGGRSRNIVADEARCVLKCENPQAVLESLDLPEQVEGSVKEGFLTLKGTGISAHCMTPEKGFNAVACLLETLWQLKDSLSHGAFMEDFHQAFGMDTAGEKLGCAMADEAGALTFNPGTVSLEEDGRIRFCSNIRYPASAEYDEVTNLLRRQLKKHHFIYEEIDHLPPICHKTDSPLVTGLMEAYREVTGDCKSQPLAIGGATYARALPNAIAFGPLFPWEEELAHEANEFMAVDSLKKMTEILICGLQKMMEIC